MNQANGQINMDLIVFIVSHYDKPTSKEVLKLAAEQGLHGGTILLGEGKANSKLLKVLGIDGTKRDLVLFAAPTNMAKKAFSYIIKNCKLEERRAGAAFRIALSRTTGISKNTIETNRMDDNYRSDSSKHHRNQLFVTIGDAGEADIVMDIFERNGILGGLLIHGRGTGALEVTHVFNIDIESEKDVLLTIVPPDKAETVLDSLTTELDLENKNSHILFTVDLEETANWLV